MRATKSHAVPCRWFLSITSVILVVASWLCASAASVTFLVTSDSHYDALENEDRNQRDRITIDQMNEIATVRWPEELGGDLIEKPRGVLARLDLPRLRGLPSEIRRRWPPASSRLLAADVAALGDPAIDHEVGQVDTVGGPSAARKTLKRFIKRKLSTYPDSRNHPDADGTSGLSPDLHFGHISVHEIFRELAKAEGWSPANVSNKATGKREGWWGMSEAAEAFLDELVTWREVGLNMCCHPENYDEYDSLPDWAKATLAERAADRRQYVYSLEEFGQGRTRDELWNAAQIQLVREGRVHNYMRSRCEGSPRPPR